MYGAVIDPDSAWREVMSIKYYGPGNSRTNCLYWVASRPGRTAHNSSHSHHKTNDDDGDSNSHHKSHDDLDSGVESGNTSTLSAAYSGACADNSACDASGTVPVDVSLCF